MIRKKFIFLFICCLAFPLYIFASGGVSLSSSSGSIYVGSSSSFKITAKNAAGKVNITIDDSSIANISLSGGSDISGSQVFLDNNTATVSIKGIKAGTTTVKVKTIDVSTYDEENISGKTYTYKITVKEKPNYSTNNKLKSISVDGYNLQKKDNNNYYLSVNKNVETINIKAAAEDNKAKVSNVGSKKLNIGENKFEIVITSESGSKNKINVVVTRKEGYTLNDLSTIINEKDIELSLDSDTVIKKSDLDLIKKNKKIVKMNYQDIYSWIFDGNKINDTMDIKSNIKLSNDNEEISKLINYPNALYIDFSHSGKLVSGTKININLKDYFKDNDNLKLYYFNKETKSVELVKKDIVVKDSSVSLELDHCSTYFLTKSLIIDMSKIDSEGNVIIEKNYLWIIIVGGIAFLELLFIGYMFYIYEFKKGNLI